MFLFLKRLLAAAAAGCVMAIFANSFITVEWTDGRASYFISPFAQKELFEDSEAFEGILSRDVTGITRMAVIKSQLETDGAYNGRKIIDLAAYVNRTNTLEEEQITACYYLDDLIKWGNAGFKYETVYGTREEFDLFFAQESMEGEKEQAALAKDYSLQAQFARQELKYTSHAAGTDALSLRMIADMPSSPEAWEEKKAQEGVTPERKDALGVDILVPRYYSADGMDLAEYAASLEDYISLRNLLVEAVGQLYHNFTEYSGFKNYYGRDKTNIRYCYQMVVDGEIRYFSNLTDNFEEMTEEEITELFSSFGKNLYYNPDQVEISTNTKITTEQMRRTLGNYEYAFGENSRVWIGVDTSYKANDGLAQGRHAFMRFMPYYWQTAAAGALAVILAVYLLGLVTAREGRVEAENEDGYVIALKKGDRIPSELPLFGLLLLLAAFGLLCMAAGRIVTACDDSGVWEEGVDPFLLVAGIAAGAFLLDWIGEKLYLSLVRRLKAHVFWRYSLTRRLGRWVKGGILSLYEHSSIVTRLLLPFLALMAFNLLMSLLGAAGILLAGIVDLGAAVLLYQERKDLQQVVRGTQTIGSGRFDHKINASHMHGENRELAEAVNSIGDGIAEAVATSMKDERLKADLITNVSHDIKTPLTSIINFVNLLKRENIEDERIKGYIQVLDAKSQRLKQLTDDLVEASKISSGNISLQMERINFKELINQTIGEFAEKMEEKNLCMISSMPEEPVYIEADSRRIWRVAENLFGNVYKYALEGTRVYLDLTVREEEEGRFAVFSMKNISAQPLNINADELTERFIRGDVSRSTEGSGLGLSIAQNLTVLQKGQFQIYLDGDLFKVILRFPCLEQGASNRTLTEKGQAFPQGS